MIIYGKQTSFILKGSSMQKNISYKRGETWVAYCELRDGNNLPMNLANSTIQFKVANTANANVLFVDSSNGISITNASSGKCKLTVVPSLQSNLQFQTYEYEIFVTLADGTKSSQANGELKVEKGLFS
jgi:hypothetical protein